MVSVKTVVFARVCVFLQHYGFLSDDNRVFGKVFLFVFERTSLLPVVLVCFKFFGRNSLKTLREHGERGVVSCGTVVVFVVLAAFVAAVCSCYVSPCSEALISNHC